MAMTMPSKQLLTQITTYNHSSMWQLRIKLEAVRLDDALLCGAFRCEFTALDSGYPFWRLLVNGTLLGIVDVRDNQHKVVPRLTAYLYWLGFRHHNVRLVQCGATAPHLPPMRKRVGGEWMIGLFKDRDLPKLFEVE